VLDRVDGVGGGEAASVVERDALAQAEGPGDAVGGGGPLLGEVRHGDALFVELDEAVVEGAEVLVGREGAGRVEGLGGGGGGPGDAKASAALRGADGGGLGDGRVAPCRRAAGQGQQAQPGETGGAGQHGAPAQAGSVFRDDRCHAGMAFRLSFR